MGKLLEGLKSYFQNNSKEQILKDWAKTEEYDKTEIKEDTKTVESRANDYAKSYQDRPINIRYQKNRRCLFEVSRDGYLAGHQSRDEEIQALKEQIWILESVIESKSMPSSPF